MERLPTMYGIVDEYERGVGTVGSSDQNAILACWHPCRVEWTKSKEDFMSLPDRPFAGAPVIPYMTALFTETDDSPIPHCVRSSCTNLCIYTCQKERTWYCRTEVQTLDGPLWIRTVPSGFWFKKKKKSRFIFPLCVAAIVHLFLYIYLIWSELTKNTNSLSNKYKIL